ncbi:glycerol-3-phosphate 1-O-acyltransferase [bacterium]|nr:MAG: glycerol-3-phosphate 1-O-acyltransferase [bacterium]
MRIFYWIAAAYLIGAIPFGIIFSLIMAGIDPRASGSGNIGATNVLRTIGKKAGLFTLIADLLKGALPVWAASVFLKEPHGVALVGFAAFAGHLFPIYLGFRGGKGVATGAGVMLVASPATLAVSTMVFALLLAWKKIVSLGSIFASIIMPLAAYLLGEPEYTIQLAGALATLTILKHRSNILRLVKGVEPRIVPWARGKG